MVGPPKISGNGDYMLPEIWRRRGQFLFEESGSSETKLIVVWINSLAKINFRVAARLDTKYARHLLWFKKQSWNSQSENDMQIFPSFYPGSNILHTFLRKFKTMTSRLGFVSLKNDGKNLRHIEL